MQIGAEENFQIKGQEVTGRWQRKFNKMEIHTSYSLLI
jgi:hypothetical protein